MSYVDIKPICEYCNNRQPVELVMVGLPSEGGGWEQGYICCAGADMSRGVVSHGCDTDNQCEDYTQE